MPLSIFRRLGLSEARPTTVTLQLADRSLKHHKGGGGGGGGGGGVIEDVLVKVDKFLFSEDFIVLDMEEDKEILQGEVVNSQDKSRVAQRVS